MGKGGGKGGGSNINVQPSPYEQAMANIANSLFSQTAPLRSNFMEDWGGFMRPQGTVGGTTPMYGTSPTGPYPATTNAGGGFTPATYTGYSPATPSTATQMGDANKAAAGTAPNTAPDAWMQAYNDYAHVPTLPLGVNITPSTTPGDTTSNPLPRPVGFYGNSVSNPLYEYQPGRYYDRTGTEYLGDRGGVMWAPGYSPTGAGSPTTPGGPGTPTGGIPTWGASSARYNPYNIPGYQPLYQLSRQGIESQFGQARQNLIGSLPRGGPLNEGLTNLEMQRAIQAGSLPATIASPLIQDIMNKAYGAAWNSPQTSIAGLGGAANAYASRTGSTGAYQLGSNAQTMSGLGGLGSLMSMGGKGGKGAGDMFSGATAAMSIL